MPRMIAASEISEVVLYLRACPILRANKLAPYPPLRVDDVGLRRPRCSEGQVRLLREVEREDHVAQMIVGDVLPIGLRIRVKAHRQHHHIRNLLWQLHQGRELLQARRTPRGPEIQDDRLAPITIQADRLRLVMNGEVGRDHAHLRGMIAAITASSGRSHQQQNKRGKCALPSNSAKLVVQTAHFPIIKGKSTWTLHLIRYPS